MKKVICLLLTLIVFPIFSFAETAEADPVVGVWSDCVQYDEGHTYVSYIFYPFGTVWVHTYYIEQNHERRYVNESYDWYRIDSSTVEIYTSNSKIKCVLLGNDLIYAVDDFNNSALLSRQHSAAFDFLQYYEKNTDPNFYLLTKDPYTIGEDLPAGNYIAYYPFTSSRLFIYSSSESYSKNFSSSSESIGSTWNLVMDLSLTFEAGQIIQYSHPGAILYYLPGGYRYGK